MNKLIITVLAKDRPGIIATITHILYELECNLENVNQMILQDQFAGIFLVEVPDPLTRASLSEALSERTRDTDLVIHVNPVSDPDSPAVSPSGEVFLITTSGPDQQGLVARLSRIIAGFNANIINLKAVFKGGRDPQNNVMSYQVAITPDVDSTGLFKALREKARELDLDIRIQHRNIFDAINKI